MNLSRNKLLSSGQTKTELTPQFQHKIILCIENYFSFCSTASQGFVSRKSEAKGFRDAWLQKFITEVSEISCVEIFDKDWSNRSNLGYYNFSIACPSFEQNLLQVPRMFCF